MPGRKKALEFEVIPAWRAFLRSVLKPRGAPNRMAIAFMDEMPGRSTIDRARRIGAVISWIARMTRARNPTYPEPSTVWAFAAAARRGVGHAWCAGPLALFAASHLEAFVTIFTMVTAIPPARCIELVSTVSATIATISDTDADGVRSRNTWTLSPDESAAFEKANVAFLRGARAARHPDIEVCMMAAKAFDAPLATRKRVVIEFLLRYLAA